MKKRQKIYIEVAYTSKQDIEYALRVIDEIKKERPNTEFHIKAVGSF